MISFSKQKSSLTLGVTLPFTFCLLTSLTACGKSNEKSDDQNSVDLILRTAAVQKIVHMPNDHVKQMLAEHNVGIRRDGCPDKFSRVPGFMEADGSQVPGCMPGRAMINAPSYVTDYLKSGEKALFPNTTVAQ